MYRGFEVMLFLMEGISIPHPIFVFAGFWSLAFKEPSHPSV
jgi:hypothetical protein